MWHQCVGVWHQCVGVWYQYVPCRDLKSMNVLYQLNSGRAKVAGQSVPPLLSGLLTSVHALPQTLAALGLVRLQSASTLQSEVALG